MEWKSARARQLADVEDPLERLRQCAEVIERGQATLAEARTIRAAAIKDLRKSGMSRPEIARASGVSSNVIAEAGS
jgi:DNA-binding transcriptional regulator YiaG